MDDFLDRALHAARLAAASRADVRALEPRSRRLERRNHGIDALPQSMGTGSGVRVLADGPRELAASAVSTGEPDRRARLAERIARPSARLRHDRSGLTTPAPQRGLALTNRSGSIAAGCDLQFGGDVGCEVRRGERLRMLETCADAGIAPESWNRLAAACHVLDREIRDATNRGKRQTIQIMRTGQGASPARSRDVRVGVGCGA